MERRPLTTQRTTTPAGPGDSDPPDRAPPLPKPREGGRQGHRSCFFVASPLPERCQWTRARMRPGPGTVTEYLHSEPLDVARYRGGGGRSGRYRGPGPGYLP